MLKLAKFDPEAWLSPAALVTSRWNGFGAIYDRDLATRIRRIRLKVKYRARSNVEQLRLLFTSDCNLRSITSTSFFSRHCTWSKRPILETTVTVFPIISSDVTLLKVATLPTKTSRYSLQTERGRRSQIFRAHVPISRIRSPRNAIASNDSPERTLQKMKNVAGRWVPRSLGFYGASALPPGMLNRTREASACTSSRR